MAEKYLVALDCGKATTKILISKSGSNEIKDRQSYPSVIGTPNSINNGTRFRVLNDSNEEAIDFIMQSPDGTRTNKVTSKRDVYHKAFALYSIAKYVKDGDRVDVALCMPMETYLNEADRNDLISYILPDGEIAVEIGGEKKKFFVDKKIAFSEGIGIISTQPKLFKDDDVAVIDIGGYNTHAIQVQNGNLIPSTMLSLSDVGSLQLFEEILTALNSKGIAIDSYQLEATVKKGFVRNFKDKAKEELSREIIEGCVNARLEKIFQKMQEEQWKNIDSLRLVFVGGTSLSLKNAIEKYFGEQAKVLDEQDAIYSNVEGAMKKLRKS